MDLGLAGKSVIVTGGGSHIGRAIVLGLAAEGAHVTVGDIDPEQAGKVAEAANSAGPGDVQVVLTDVSRLDQAENLVRSARDAQGRVDVLINNAGWWDPPAFFTQTDPEVWQKVIQVNYGGVLNCTRAVLETMIEQNKGAIVSLSSDASRQGEPRQAVYSGAKAAINGFMKTIAKENGRFGIRCNAICPGFTVPQSGDEIGSASLWVNKDELYSEDQLAKIAHNMPLRKLGKARDVANAVLFLSSDEAAGHITGQVLSVSGGYSMVG